MNIWIAIMLLLTVQQGMGPGPGTPHSSGSCTLPPVTYDWLASNTCSAGTACMNDAVGGNNALAVSTSPTYSASGTFSQPYVTFNGTNNELAITTPIPPAATTVNYSFLAVGNYAAVSGGYILGGSTSVGYRLDPKQQIINSGIAVTATGTASYTTGVNLATVVTFNASTNAYAFSKLSGGSVTADGSGTATTATYSNATSFIGANGTLSYNAFSTPEIIFYNGIWTGGNLTTAAAYVACKYSI